MNSTSSPGAQPRDSSRVISAVWRKVGKSCSMFHPMFGAKIAMPSASAAHGRKVSNWRRPAGCASITSRAEPAKAAMVYFDISPRPSATPTTSQ